VTPPISNIKRKTTTYQHKITKAYRRVTSSTPAQLNCTPTILSVLLSMKKEGYSQATLRFVSKALKFLNGNCNLDDPESVKEFLLPFFSVKLATMLVCEHNFCEFLSSTCWRFSWITYRNY